MIYFIRLIIKKIYNISKYKKIHKKNYILFFIYKQNIFYEYKLIYIIIYINLSLLNKYLESARLPTGENNQVIDTLFLLVHQVTISILDFLVLPSP